MFVKSDNKTIDKVSGKNGNVVVFTNGIAQVSEEDAAFLTRVPGYTIVQNAEGDLKPAAVVQPVKPTVTKPSTIKAKAVAKAKSKKSKEEK